MVEGFFVLYTMIIASVPVTIFWRDYCIGNTVLKKPQNLMTMRNNFYRFVGCLLLMVAVSGLSSCDWEDDEEDLTGTYIGLWDLREEIVDDYIRTTVYKTDPDTDMFIEFQENGDFFIYHSLSIDRHEYYDLVFEDRPENAGYWAVSGQRLILKFDSNFEEVWDMEDITSRHLELEYIPYEGEKMAKHRSFDRVDYSKVDFLD